MALQGISDSRLPQWLHVMPGRCTKGPFVRARELGDIAVAHPLTRRVGVKPFAQPQTEPRLQPKLFLELSGTQRRRSALC